MPRSEPQRSCLSCRKTTDKNRLLRFVLAPDRMLVPDLQSRLPGRGAYTCFTESCLRTAVTRKQFARAFKAEVLTGSPNELVALVTGLMEERIASYLALANKAGKIVSGSESVTEMLARHTPGAICIARDISSDIGEKMIYLADRSGAAHFSLFDKEKLGALLGKAPRSVVAVERGGFSESILKEFERYRNFFEGGTGAT